MRRSWGIGGVEQRAAEAVKKLVPAAADRRRWKDLSLSIMYSRNHKHGNVHSQSYLLVLEGRKSVGTLGGFPQKNLSTPYYKNRHAEQNCKIPQYIGRNVSN
jgi:hypothetical protein